MDQFWRDFIIAETGITVPVESTKPSDEEKREVE